MDVSKLKIKNQFWEDVLKCWAEYNSTGSIRVENQLIWYNSLIRIDKKPIFWRDVYCKGLKYVYQLFQDKKFKSDETIYEEYGLSKLRYNGLKKAIPKEWKAFFQQTEASQYMPIPPHNYDQCRYVYKGSFSRRMYKYLQQDCMEIHNKYMKWREELGPNWCEGLCDYASKHREMYRITNVPKFRSFQYRLLQRGLVTNIQLEKWKIINSDRCFFCSTEKETVVHLLYKCSEVRKLWSSIKIYLAEKFGMQEWSLNPTSVVLNDLVPQKYHVINFICLVTKQFIYKQKCLKLTLNFPIWKAYVQQIESIEKYIAVKNGKLAIHQRKWGVLSQNSGNMRDYIQEYVQSM